MFTQPALKPHKTPSQRSEEHTSELQSRENLVCRLLLEKKNDEKDYIAHYGIIRRSGRYPWGTEGWGEGADRGGSETLAQGSRSHLDDIPNMLNKGLSQP